MNRWRGGGRFEVLRSEFLDVLALVPSLQLLELSLAYTDRLAELGIAPSVGSRGDSYDNALAEAVNAAYKTELINRAKP